MCRHAIDLSYGKVVEIIKDVTGEAQVSDQKTQQIVLSKALEVDLKKAQHIKKILSEKPLPIINTNVAIYDSTIKEVLLEIDGIVSKKQKEKRDKIPKEHKSFVSNTLALIGVEDGKMTCLIGEPNEENTIYTSLSEEINACIIENFWDQEIPINIVAINDGAKDIRNLLLITFGTVITVILDWYHLKKKVKEYMSMFGLPRKEKDELIKKTLNFLWHGGVDLAIENLKFMDIKNIEKVNDLIGYFEKHKSEIIDYERRKKIGKTIGSGRIEKVVDQIVARRQKNNGMSWSVIGSKSLAILTTIDYNNDWEKIWNTKISA